MEGLSMNETKAGYIGGAIGGGLAAMAQNASIGESRQSAKGVLRQRVASLRTEADRLEALGRALPEELPTKADEALWALLLSKR
jgi:hypothetical protein